MSFDGIAAMYLSMPMSAEPLPVLGTCKVSDKKMTLTFPLATVSFDLPEPPFEAGKEMEFKMAGPRGEMTLKVGYKSEVRAFMGQGVRAGQNVLTFIFFRH